MVALVDPALYSDSSEKGRQGDIHLFEQIAQDIKRKGYSIHPNALPDYLVTDLISHLDSMKDSQFEKAGIGREQNLMVNHFVRSDEICWITGTSKAGISWLNWTQALQTYLNRRLFLGLFSFESHFAHYGPGDFYKKHFDAFKGETNRILSLVVYLNANWTHDDGGELVLYLDETESLSAPQAETTQLILDSPVLESSIKVLPTMGTVVAFLSEDFPHEVLAANRDRYSIAGWFRLNTSTADKVDPPV